MEQKFKIPDQKKAEGIYQTIKRFDLNKFSNYRNLDLRV